MMHKHYSQTFVELFIHYPVVSELDQLNDSTIGILNRFLKQQIYKLKDNYCKTNVKSYYIDPNNLKKSRNNVVYTPILHQRTYFNPDNEQCENKDKSTVKPKVYCDREIVSCKNIANNDIQVLGQNESINLEDVCTFKSCYDI